MQTKEAKRQAAIARNEHNRQKYEQQGKAQGLKDHALQDFVETKIGIPKARRTYQ